MSQNKENFKSSQLNLIRIAENIPVDLNVTTPYPGDYIRLTLLNSTGGYADYQFFSNKQYEGEPEIKIYEDINGISVKPNEVLEQNYVAEGNYTLQFDFLRNIFSAFNNGINLQYADGKFVITEISPSRKEIRVIARNYDTAVIQFDATFQHTFNSEVGTVKSIDDGYKDYTFDWVVTLDEGINIPIVNTTFDDISSDDTTLILRLNKPIPTSIEKLTDVGIQREVVTTQTQDIFYVSNIKTHTIGSSLEVDIDSWDGEYTPTTDYEENYEELIDSASITELDQQKIESEQNSDLNLNVDYKDFKNHTFFGSAVSKLENFKSKVEKIENYISEVSNSLNITGSLTGSYIIQKRQNAFTNISNVVKTFTPYERFLYYDNQTTTTSSAPGLGNNYAFSTPVKLNNSQENKLLTNYDGFKVVYKHTDSASAAQKSASYVDITTNMYHINEAPFYNYSGSVYLSFLMKGDEWINNSTGTSKGKLTLANTGNVNGYGMEFKLPYHAYHSSSILEPNLTGSKYQRFIFLASQSYWRPSGSATGSVGDGVTQYVAEIEQDSLGGGPHWSNQNYYQILSSSTQIASASMTASSYPIVLPEFYNELGSHLTSSATPFTGSVLPAGELFRMHWFSHDSASLTSSYMTDVKITLNNPTNIKPFAQLYSTSSAEWQNWYNGMHDSASVYDSFNINSLTHNLPEKIISGSPDVLPFINMWGEHFDGVRNYIDTYKTFYNRGYEEDTSVPKNLLPILADNLGWELINPFTGSLSTYFNSVSGSTENAQNVTNNTWLKLLNNLVYIYKSKGTMASVRALLNIYGYPPELISLRQYGGASPDMNPRFIDDTPTTLLSGLGGLSGNVSFYSELKTTWVLNLKNNNINATKSWHKYPRLPWYTSGSLQQGLAAGRGIEFNIIPNTFVSGNLHGTPVYKLIGPGNPNTAEQPWGIFLTKSGSNNLVRAEFVISKNTPHPTTIFTFPGNAHATSCSTDYFEIGGGKLFNVSLFQMTHSSNKVNHSQSYEIRVTSKTDDKITLYTTGTLNVTSSMINQNFVYTGSAISQPNNLFVGNTYNGAIFDIRMWKNALSHSKTKQHTLNPFSVVGNDVNSMESELIYRFRLNEGYDSGSTSGSKVLYDANPLQDIDRSYSGDYSNTMSFDCDKLTYTKRLIDTTKFSPRTDGIGQRNDNFLLSDVSKTMIDNLNPIETSFKSNYDTMVDDNQSISKDIEFIKSPTDVYDDYITDVLADKDITQYFAKWEDLYEPVYSDLDELREKINKNISVNINEYIEAQANLFNPSILEAIQSLLPAQTKFTAGVVLKQNLLERTKIKYLPASLKEYTIYSTNFSNFYDLSSTYIPEIYEDIIDFDQYTNITTDTYTLYENTSFYLTDYVGIDSTYELVMSDEITNYFNPVGSMVDVYLGDLDKTNYWVFSSEYLTTYDSNLTLPITDLSLSEYISPLLFNTLNLQSHLNLTVDNYSIYESNLIDNIPDFTWIVSSPIETSIELITNYYNYIGSLIDVINSNSITLIEEDINYNIIFQNIYESNTLDLQDYLVYSMSLYDIVDSNRLDYTRDIINYSILFQNIYESNTLDLQDYLNFSMILSKIYLGDLNVTSIQTPSINLEEIYEQTLNKENYEQPRGVFGWLAGLSQSKANLHMQRLQLFDYEGNEVTFILDSTIATSTSEKIAVTTDFCPHCIAASARDAINLAEAEGKLNIHAHTYSTTGIIVELNITTVGSLGERGIPDPSGTAINDPGSNPAFMASIVPTGTWPRRFDTIGFWKDGHFGSGQEQFHNKTKLFSYNMALDNIIQSELDIMTIQTPLLTFQEIYQTTLNESDGKTLLFTLSGENINTILSNNISIYDDEIEYNISMLDIYSTIMEDAVAPLLSSEYLSVLTFDLPEFPYKSLNINYIEPITDTITELQDMHTNTFENIHHNWGTGSNHTHFINWNDSGTLGDYNTEYQSPHIFYDLIGDIEEVSESRKPVSCSSADGRVQYKKNADSMPCYTDWHCEPTDWKCHYGERVVWDEVSKNVGAAGLNPGFTHYSRQVTASLNGGKGSLARKGRVIGRTRFFSTASNGDIVYPANHWRNFHTAKDQMENLYYGRTKFYVDTIDVDGNIVSNVRAFRGQFMNGKDVYPDELVYGIKIEGSDTDNVLRVERPGDRPTVKSGSDGGSGNSLDSNPNRGG